MLSLDDNRLLGLVLAARLSHGLLPSTCRQLLGVQITYPAGQPAGESGVTVERPLLGHRSTAVAPHALFADCFIKSDTAADADSLVVSVLAVLDPVDAVDAGSLGPGQERA